ncbi:MULTISPECIES: hypothetical protein [unclassified Methylobacterium]|uniref:hypothetical protein n=1 Tax=unclassified Methylobacterium TaxID=2615210 RepID=UPI0005BBA5E0|nr:MULTISPECIES: hypothetical protein [unclassified Methylobacterium]SFU67659.1 hypothetical protein SAMN02799643_01753 [Methylobacterium sp. UNCCL125]
MLPLPLALRLAGSTRSKFNNSKISDHYNFAIPEGRPGVATMITDEAALDIAFVTALTRRGFAPQDAKTKSAEWVERIQDGRGIEPYQVFVGDGLQIPAKSGNLRTAIEHAIDPTYSPEGQTFRRATDLVVINVEEIQARIKEWSEHFPSQNEC